MFSLNLLSVFINKQIFLDHLSSRFCNSLTKSVSNYSRTRAAYSQSEGIIHKVWVEDLTKLNDIKPLGIEPLHPDVFSVFPRLDIVHKNLRWQAHYRVVDWRCITTRAELVYRSNRKPWPQKGTGRARHGSRRNHIWINGGQLSGPRGPHSYFYMLPRAQRIKGLVSMLTVKHQQNDLRLVNSFSLCQELEKECRDFYLNQTKASSDITSISAEEIARQENVLFEREKIFDNLSEKTAHYLRSVVDLQGWGPSVLFVTNEIKNLPTLVCETNDNVFEISEDHLPSDLAIRIACDSYARFIEKEQSFLSSSFLIQSGSSKPAPRALHPARGLTIMPLSGLNVWSLVHYDTIVLSLETLKMLETKLVDAQKLIISDSSRIDLSVVKSEPDWLFEKDWSKDDISPFDVEHERHFTGPVEELERIKRELA